MKVLGQKTVGGVCANPPPPQQEATLPSSTVEAKCTVNLHKDDKKRENEGIQEKLLNSAIMFIFFFVKKCFII